MTSASSWYSTYHFLEEADDHVWVYESRVVSYEGLGDVGHDAGVVAWKAFGSINPQKESCPGSLGGKTFRYQKVSGKEGHQKLEEQPVTGNVLPIALPNLLDLMWKPHWMQKFYISALKFYLKYRRISSAYQVVFIAFIEIEDVMAATAE